MKYNLNFLKMVLQTLVIRGYLLEFNANLEVYPFKWLENKLNIKKMV